MLTKNTRPIRVFLCHASNDKPSVRRLYKKLKEDNIDVWFDEEKLLPGQDWDAEIQKAVRMSDVVIICLSNKSVTKEGYVQKEIKIALDVADEKPDGTIFIIPVRLEDCNVPDRIKRWQWMNLYSSTGEISNVEYKKLLNALEMRSSQLGMLLFNANKNEQINYQFEPNSLAITPPRAWILPEAPEILNPSVIAPVDEDQVNHLGRLIQQALATLNLPVYISEIDMGPRFTRFGVEPSYRETEHGRVKVRISEFESIADDLALSLGFGDIVVHAPVPGRSYIGIDVKNKQASIISMLEIFNSKEFNRKNQFNVILGKDVIGKPIVIDLLLLPNMLIAGRSFSGKSIFIDSLISSLMIENNPNDLQFVLVDKRMVEYSIYRDSPHLLSPIMTADYEIVSAISWLLREAEDRQKLFSKVGVRTFNEYNSIAEFNERIPFIVLIISELFDLVSENPNKEKVEMLTTRLMGLARVSGIQVFISTQHSSPEVITTRLKANISSRIVFATSSSDESIAIIDQPGAERLLGDGDMLYLNMTKAVPKRVQAPFISPEEILRLIDFWKQQLI